jgi:hypothetical protein
MISSFFLCFEGMWRIGRAAATKTGPNDASGVVWAIGTSFFFRHVFYVLTNDFKLLSML